MYFYIFDYFLNKDRYAKELSKISLSLTDLGILGEEARITPVRKVDDLVKEAVQKGYKTIVAIGDDSTAHNVINAVARLDEEIYFGFIPVRHSYIASLLGIPEGEAACQVVSQRKLEKIDLGKIDDQFFISSLEAGINTVFVKSKSAWPSSIFSSFGAAMKYSFPRISLKFDDKFTVTTDLLKLLVLNIFNKNKGELKIKTNQKSKIVCSVDPKDNLFDIVVIGKLNKVQLIKYLRDLKEQDLSRIPGVSFFRSNNVEILSDVPLLITIDEQLVERRKVKINMSGKKLKAIVGKERKF